MNTYLYRFLRGIFFSLFFLMSVSSYGDSSNTFYFSRTVVLKASDIPEANGFIATKYRFFAFCDKKMQSLPTQIDILATQDSSTQDSPQLNTSVFKSNDEISFLTSHNCDLKDYSLAAHDELIGLNAEKIYRIDLKSGQSEKPYPIYLAILNNNSVSSNAAIQIEHETVFKNAFTPTKIEFYPYKHCLPKNIQYAEKTILSDFALEANLKMRYFLDFNLNNKNFECLVQWSYNGEVRLRQHVQFIVSIPRLNIKVTAYGDLFIATEGATVDLRIPIPTSPKKLLEQGSQVRYSMTKSSYLSQPQLIYSNSHSLLEDKTYFYMPLIQSNASTTTQNPVQFWFSTQRKGGPLGKQDSPKLFDTATQDQKIGFTWELTKISQGTHWLGVEALLSYINASSTHNISTPPPPGQAAVVKTERVF